MIKKSLYLICTASILSASTTMCYKKDHIDPSTIETIALSGGECQDKLSVNDMKKNGYQVDSMKLQDGKNGFNYIYVFTKEKQSKTVVATGITDEQLTIQLKKIRKKEVKQKKIEQAINYVEAGKKLYLSTCLQCHGEKGEKEAYNTSKPLNTLSLEDMKSAIQDYKLGDKDNGMAVVMNPYAGFLTSVDLEKVYNYLETLK